jgi:hypothetical protein
MKYLFNKSIQDFNFCLADIQIIYIHTNIYIYKSISTLYFVPNKFNTYIYIYRLLHFYRLFYCNSELYLLKTEIRLIL